ncbi:MAG: TonB-dependent receptor [Caulobacteraceae bacterium]|nr:TonB-dependent receptor [Caulobacteraceae bacterium]
MKNLIKASLLASVAFGCMTTAAYAQDTDTTSVDEVIVTARRTEENNQQVPAAVSAFNERALERMQAQDTTGLQGAVPNLNIVQGRGSSNATNIYIRGVGQPDALQTFDPAVGVYIDDVYLSRIRGAQMDLLDLERVEVLRGPQGTLYGKNTIGGALKLVTRKPDQEFRANASIAAGDYSMLEAKAAVSGPVSDTVALGLAGLYSSHDGYVTDRLNGREYNDKNTWGVRGALAWTPSDQVRVDIAADYSRDDAALNLGQPVNNLTTLFGAPLLTVPNPNHYNFTGAATSTLPNSTQLRHWGVSGTVTYDVSDNLTFKSITAYRNLETDDYVDIDATQLETGDAFVGVDQDQTSQEFQLLYSSDNWNVVAGVYYLRENITSHQEAYADDLIGGGITFTRFVDDDLQTTSWAGYANASYRWDNGLQLSAGIRYTEEKKDYDRATYTVSSNPLFTSVVPFPFVADDTWDDWSPMISLDYQIDDDHMIYARISQGFKSGGFNGRANSPQERTEYDPETATTYEIGAKTQWFDRTLRLNATAFFNDYQDFQARVSSLEIILGVPTPQLSVFNAGSMEIFGVEFEGQWTPIQGLLLESQIGYLNADYKEFDDLRFAAFGGSRAFQQPAFAPEWTARFAGQYEWNLNGNGYFLVGANARYRSEMALAVDNTFTNTNVRNGLWSDDYWLFDARAVWQNEDRRYSIGVYGQNLTDEVYRTEGQEFSSVGSIRTTYYGAPRTWFVRFTARY